MGVFSGIAKKTDRRAWTGCVLLGSLVTLGLWPTVLVAQVAAPASAAARILEMEALGEDLRVTFFRGSPAPSGLDVVVTGMGCGETARLFVSTPVDTVTVDVADALDDVLACGTQFRVALEDASGPVGGSVPFRVSLGCDTSGFCELVAEPWVDVGNGLLLSKELDSAMAVAAGSGDLVAAVNAFYPHLRDEMLSYALHLDRLSALYGPGLVMTPAVYWVGVREIDGEPGSGGLHLLSARVCVEEPYEQLVGATTVQTVNRCHNLGSGAGVSLTLDNGQSLTIPAFDRCTTGQGPVLSSFQWTFNGEARAGGTPGHLAEADLAIDVSFGNQPAGGAAVGAWRGPNSPQTLDVDTLGSGFGPVTTTGSTLSSVSEGQVQVMGSPPQPPDLAAAVHSSVMLTVTYGQFWLELSDPPGDSPLEGQEPVICDSDIGDLFD